MGRRISEHEHIYEYKEGVTEMSQVTGMRHHAEKTPPKNITLNDSDTIQMMEWKCSIMSCFFSF